MTHQVSFKDQTFKTQFETCTTAPPEFNHRAHIRLAYLYLCEDDTEAAYQKMRHSLKAFLRHHGVDPSKYHETMTRAWILAVKHFMVNSTSALSANDFMQKNLRLLDKQIMLTHYSKEVLFSDKARLRFIQPDLEAIPRYA